MALKHRGLGFLAPRGGPLVRRFSPGSATKAWDNDRDERVRRQLDAILHYHALAVWVALDLLACEWRSEKIGRQLDALDGLGAPAVQLDELYTELAQPTADDGTVIRASAC